MIWCVEDDSAIRDLIVYTLNSTGLPAEGFPDGESFLAALQNRPLPSLVLLDIMMPGKDGIRILEQLRRSPVTASVPVIIASAKGSEMDKVKGLDTGADDYLAKPFGMMEMVSRVRAVLRRSAPSNPRDILTHGTIRLHVSEHVVSVGSAEIDLTAKEFALLRHLMERPGRVFSREQLIESVWGMDFLGETRTIDVHVATLRTKLGPAGAAIQTVRGLGYRMEKTND